MSRWGSLHITSVFLIILGTISAANVVQTAAEIPWKEMGRRIATIWTGEGTDEVADAERNYQLIRKALAELNVTSTVGYMTDLRPGDDFQGPYYLTQYALLPVIVDRTAEGHPYVVGNFNHADTDVMNIPGLEPVTIAGRRVLFRRRPH
jgi:hypothetical protein